jgi:hypothetical protein
LRAIDQYIAAVYANRQAVERLSLARSRDAKPGGRFVQCAMRITHEMALIFAEKLIPHKIQRSGHMAAAIHVGVEISLIIDEKRIDAIFAAYKPKFLDTTGRQLFRFGDNSPAESAFPLHAPLVTPENDSVNNQRDDIQNEKEKGQINGDGHSGRKIYLESLSIEFRIRFTSFGVWRPAIPMICINSVVISAVI